MKTCCFVASGRVAACAALLMAGVSVAFAQAADERPWVNLLPGGAWRDQDVTLVFDPENYHWGIN